MHVSRTLVLGLIFCFKDLFILKVDFRERKGEREMASISWFTSPVVQWTELDQCKSRTQELFLVSHVVQRSQGLEPSPTLFPGHKQRARSEVDQPGFEPLSLWDTGTAQGAFTCAIPRLIPAHRSPFFSLSVVINLVSGFRIPFEWWFVSFCHLWFVMAM